MGCVSSSVRGYSSESPCEPDVSVNNIRVATFQRKLTYPYRLVIASRRRKIASWVQVNRSD
jgi:hypothetical protein